MRSRKLYNKILAGFMSAAMLFTSIPAITAAAEDAEDGLIAEFSFDGESGLSGSGAKAAVQGSASYAQSYDGSQAARISSGFWLNVTKEDNTPLLRGLEEITISYESKPSDSNNTGWSFYAAPNTASQTYNAEHYLGIMDKTSDVYVERYNCTNGRNSSGNAGGLSSADWKHVDVVYREGSTSLYVNGEHQQTSSTTYKMTDILTQNGGILQIGKANWGNNGEYYNGLIDNFKIYDRALSEDEIWENSPIRFTNLFRGAKANGLTVITTEQDDEERELTLYVSKNNTTADITQTPLEFELMRGTEIISGEQDFYDMTEPFEITIRYEERTENWQIKTVLCNNPVLPGEYADPDIDFFDGKYYIYPTSDGFEGWGGYQFRVFSSYDLVTWEDEGVFLDLKADQPYLNEKGVEVGIVPWATGNGWAPAIEEKDGKYYFYFSGHDPKIGKDGAKSIGVAVSDSPTGPFVAEEEPLITFTQCGWNSGQVIDPSIYTEEDGTSYMLFGNGNPAIVQLGDDMVSWVPGTLKVYSGATGFREAITVNKRDGKYHFTWSYEDTGSENYSVYYGISDNLYGPIEYKYPILQKDLSKDIKGTGHHNIVYLPQLDEYYIAYHRFLTPLGQVTSGFGYHRETCLEQMEFGDDGLIQVITPTLTGITVPVYPDPIFENQVTVTYQSGENGKVKGRARQIIFEGESTTAVTAIPDQGYEFVEWSDGNKEAERTDIDVKKDIDVTAIFDLEKVTVTYQAGTGGKISGEAQQRVVKGTDAQTVTAVADPGYKFAGWSDGLDTAERTDENMTEDFTVMAEFELTEVTVTYTAGTGGKINGKTQQVIPWGTNAEAVTAAADSGYTFSKWSDGVTTAQRRDTNVTASKTVTAQFVKNTDPSIHPTKVELNKSKITIGKKETFKLKANVVPALASQKVNWKSSKPKVVSVSSAGTIKGLKKGSATITATAVNGKKMTCKVTVKKAPKKISITKPKANTVTLKKGKTLKLKVKIPNGTASYKISYSSSKKAVATVNTKGKIKAVKKGSTKITVKTFNKKKAVLKLNVV